MRRIVARRQWAVLVAALAVLLLGVLPALAAPVVAGPAIDPEVDAALAAGGSVPLIVLFGQAPALPSSAQAVSSLRLQQDRAVRALQLAGAPARNVKAFPITPGLAVTTDGRGLAALRALAGVERIVLDRLDQPLDRPEGAPASPVPPLDQESNELIGAPAAWANGWDGTSWYVAVLDTGTQSSPAVHPFLAGKIAYEYCYSTNNPNYEGSVVTSWCPNGQATGSEGQPGQVGPGAANDCPVDVTGCGHGTHVAGIALGQATFDGTPGYSGVAPRAKLISVQVFSRVEGPVCAQVGSTVCTLTFMSDQIAALDQVATLAFSGVPIGAVNMSLGGGRFTGACDQDPRKLPIDILGTGTSISLLRVPTVIAAGNNGWSDAMSAPACISTAISVANSTKADEIAESSNRNSQTSLVAPGSSISSSVPVSTYGVKTGTSMAAPAVAGAWALMRQRAPTASVADILAAFQATGVVLTDLSSGITKPRIRVNLALNQFPNRPATGPTPGPNDRGLPYVFKGNPGGW